MTNCYHCKQFLVIEIVKTFNLWKLFISSWKEPRKAEQIMNIMNMKRVILLLQSVFPLKLIWIFSYANYTMCSSDADFITWKFALFGADYTIYGNNNCVITLREHWARFYGKSLDSFEIVMETIWKNKAWWHGKNLSELELTISFTRILLSVEMQIHYVNLCVVIWKYFFWIHYQISVPLFPLVSLNLYVLRHMCQNTVYLHLNLKYTYFKKIYSCRFNKKQWYTHSITVFIC